MVWFKKLIILTLIFFVLLNLYGCSQTSKKPMSEPTYKYLVLTKKDVQNQNWEQASCHFAELKKAWQKAKPLHQLNQSTDTIDEFESALARLEAFIKNKDKSQSAAEINLLMVNWQELKSL